MSKLNLTISHNLDQDEATERIKNCLDNLKSQFHDKIKKAHETWDGNNSHFRFTIMGFQISGNIKVRPSKVELSGIIPFPVLVLRKQIKAAIKEHAEKLLA